MAKSYDQKNKITDKYLSIIKQKDEEIEVLKTKLTKAEEEISLLRKRLYEAGEGKGERNRLEKEIIAKERDNKTLENKIRDLDGSKLISSFTKERQELIRKIKALKFNNSIFNALAYKFKDGLDNVIEIASRIKTGNISDMDYFTFVFRDDIIGLLEKMFKAILTFSEPSATNYLLKLRDGRYELPKHYYQRNPKLKDKNVINNVLALLNLQSTGYHGTYVSMKHIKKDKDTNEVIKPDKFLNLSNKDQLDAIFTLLEFMYDVFTNKDYEANLLSISQSWFKTI